MPKTKKTSKTDLRQKLRRGGFYFIPKDGKEVPYASVTKIISVLDKPMIQRWYGQMVYRAVMANPDLDEKDAMNAPYMTSGKAKTRGTIVHSIVENYKSDPTHIEKLNDTYKGYGKAFQSWVEEYNANIIVNEKTVYSDKYRFAGTLDLIVKLNESQKPIILDIKTGKDLYPEVQLQLSAYQQCMKEMGKEVGMGALLLKPDGTYKFERYDESLIKQFLACKVIYEWKSASILEQIKNYQGYKHA